MNFKTPTFRYALSCALLFLSLLTFSVPANAAMYKYITKDGQTLLTGEKLKGGGHKLVKIFKIKKKGAYKSSERKKSKKKKYSSKRKRSKKRKYKKSKKYKKKSRIRRNHLGKIAKANGRDNGIIFGCSNNKHLDLED